MSVPAATAAADTAAGNGKMKKPEDVDMKNFPFNYECLDQFAEICCTDGKEKEDIINRLSSHHSFTLPLDAGKCNLEKGDGIPYAYVPTLLSNNQEFMLVEEDKLKGEKTEQEIGTDDNKKLVLLVRWNLPSQSKYNAWTYILGFLDAMCSRVKRISGFRLSEEQYCQLRSAMSFLIALFNGGNDDEDEMDDSRPRLSLTQVIQTICKNVDECIDIDSFCRWLFGNGLCILTHLWMTDYKDESLQLMKTVTDFVGTMCNMKPELDYTFMTSVLRMSQVIRRNLVEAGTKNSQYLIAAHAILFLIDQSINRLAGRGLYSDDTSNGSSFLDTLFVNTLKTVCEAFFLCARICPPSLPASDESWTVIESCLTLFNDVLDYALHVNSPHFVQSVVEPFDFDQTLINRIHLIVICGMQYRNDGLISSCVAKTFQLIATLIDLSAESLTPLSSSLLNPTMFSFAELQFLGVKDQTIFKRIMLCNIAELTHSKSSREVRQSAWNLLSWCCMLKMECIDIPYPYSFSLSNVFAKETSMIYQSVVSLVEESINADASECAGLSSAMISALDFLHSTTIYQPVLSSSIFAHKQEGGEKVMCYIKRLFVSCYRKGKCWPICDRILGLLLAMKEKKETASYTREFLSDDSWGRIADLASFEQNESGHEGICLISCQSKALLLLSSELVQAELSSGFEKAMNKLLCSSFVNYICDIINSQTVSGDAYAAHFDPTIFERLKEYSEGAKIDINLTMVQRERPAWLYHHSDSDFVIDCPFVERVLNEPALQILLDFNNSVMSLSLVHDLANALTVFWTYLIPRVSSFNIDPVFMEKSISVMAALVNVMVYKPSGKTPVFQFIILKSLSECLLQLTRLNTICGKSKSGSLAKIDDMEDEKDDVDVGRIVSDVLINMLSKPLTNTVDKESDLWFFKHVIVGSGEEKETNNNDVETDEDTIEIICSVLSAFNQLSSKASDVAKAEAILPLISCVISDQYNPVKRLQDDQARFSSYSRLYNLCVAVLCTLLKDVGEVVVKSALDGNLRQIVDGLSAVLVPAVSYSQNYSDYRKPILTSLAVSALDLLTVCAQRLDASDAPSALLILQRLGVGASYINRVAPGASSECNLPIWRHFLALMTFLTNKFGGDELFLGSILDIAISNKEGLFKCLDPITNIEDAKFPASFLQSLCRRFEVWAPKQSEFATKMLQTLARAVCQIVEFTRAQGNGAAQEKLLAIMLVALRTAMPSFERTRTAQFISDFSSSDLLQHLYKDLFKPQRATSEPSLDTLIDCAICAVLHERHSSDLWKTVICESLSILIVLVSIYWEDNTRGTNERKNIVRYVLYRLKGTTDEGTSGKKEFALFHDLLLQSFGNTH